MMPDLAAIPTRYTAPGALTRWTIRILALIALGVSVFLFYEEMTGGVAAVPGCGPESGCSAVLTSPWARWYGIPVAAPGIVIYAIILAASLHIGPSKPPSTREGLGEGTSDGGWRMADGHTASDPSTIRHHKSAMRPLIPALPQREKGPDYPRRRAAWIIVLLTSLVAAGAAIWFILVQAVLLHALCKYCDTVHACGLILTAIVLYTAPIGRRRLTPAEPADPMMIPPVAAGGLAVLACLLVAGFVAVQWIMPTPTAAVQRFVSSTGQSGAHDVPLDTGPGPHRVISLPLRGGGRVRLSPHDYPVLGSPDAPVILVELFDYTCPHCRKLHEQLEQARKRYGKQLAIIALPTPLDADCNFLYQHTDALHEGACELAKLALAVWKASRDAAPDESALADGALDEGAGSFETFHNWLFASAAPRSVKAARAQAIRLVGAQALKRAMSDPWIAKQINHDVNLYAINGGSLPQLLTPEAIIRGRPQTAAELFTLLESVTKLQSGD